MGRSSTSAAATRATRTSTRRSPRAGGSVGYVVVTPQTPRGEAMHAVLMRERGRSAPGRVTASSCSASSPSLRLRPRRRRVSGACARSSTWRARARTSWSPDTPAGRSSSRSARSRLDRSRGRAVDDLLPLVDPLRVFALPGVVRDPSNASGRGAAAGGRRPRAAPMASRSARPPATAPGPARARHPGAIVRFRRRRGGAIPSVIADESSCGAPKFPPASSSSS